MADGPCETVKDLLAQRDVRYDAAALIGRVDKGTISKIATGKTRAQPETVVRLARGLGVSARRMQAACDASYAAAHPEERIPA